jgi:hypothetical protein
MLSIFRRREPIPEPEPLTCNERIRNFWNWFQEVAPAHYAAIEDKKCDSLTAATSAKVDECLPGFGWVYGPGENGVGHSLTITGEGVEHRQLLALHWLSQAPEIDGWTFYASRQPGPIKGHSIIIGGHKIDPKEIWVTPSIDEENECVDMTIWHPLWQQIEKKQQWTIVFLFLDEALGEYGTQWWIGDIRMENDRLAESFPLEELPEFVSETVTRFHWKKYPPGTSYSLFRINPSEEKFPRSDLLTLNTVAPNLFRDHREAKGNLADPFEEIGADYLYIAIPKKYFPIGAETDARGEIEDKLEAALASKSSGRCIGGGLGLHHGYVDLLIFDGKRSIEIIREVLQTFDFPEGTSIEYFASEKRGNRILL